MIKAVLDANVFISSVINQQGFSARIFKQWRAGGIVVLISKPILEEIDRVMRYPRISKRHKMSSQELDIYLTNLTTASIFVEDTPTLEVVTEDPTDNRYLECAVAGEADYIVTGDDHLLSINSYQDIMIVTPRQFWMELEK